MKIYIVCPRLCHGGAERVAVSLANGFVARGHEVTFFADLYEEQTYLLDKRARIENLVPQTTNKIKKWGGAIGMLRKHLKKERPDVIIGIMSLCSIVVELASIGMGIPVIATEHNSFERPESAPMPFFIRLYKFYLCKMFSCVTVLTEADKEVIGNRLRNVVVMPNPLAITHIESMPPKKNFILAAGRVDNWHVKGFDVLIRAWGSIVNSDKGIVNSEGWKLVIAGVWRNPAARTYLDGIAKDCGVQDRIVYTGFVEDMQKLYAESSVFVLSSRYEGFGLVLIEAMSQGGACVACDYKGRQREIICPEGLGSRFNVQSSNSNFEACENGILCEPDDVEALTAGIQKMIEDDDYRECVRKNAVERSKYYSIGNTMDRWETLLKQIV